MCNYSLMASSEHIYTIKTGVKFVLSGIFSVSYCYYGLQTTDMCTLYDKLRFWDTHESFTLHWISERSVNLVK